MDSSNSKQPEQEPNVGIAPHEATSAPSQKQNTPPINPAFSKFSNAEEMGSVGKDLEPRPRPAPPSNLQRLRTFKSDIAEVMNKQNASLVSMAAAEQERRGDPSTTQQSAPKTFSIKKILVGLLGGTLLIGGIAIIVYALFFRPSNQVPTLPTIPSLIFTEEKQEVDTTSTTPRALIQILTDTKDAVSLSLGSIIQFYPVSKSIDGTLSLLSTQDFFSAIGARVSDPFLRSLGNVFTLGVHVFDGNQPFLLLSTNSYENTFAGMLAWEDTIQTTLAPLFGPVLPTQLENVTLSSTTTPAGTLPKQRTFQDRVIRNIDTRVLTNDNGDIVLLYAFPNQQRLVVTTNEQTLMEIISRLNSTRVF
jgi:hypothetical protein